MECTGCKARYLRRMMAGILTLIGLMTGLTTLSAAESTNKLVINADLGKHTISEHIYGHFAEHLGRCIYGGIWVGENSDIPNTRGIRNDVVEALRKIRIPNLRWPGGCFADTYHWKDGIGPKGERPTIVNVHWGGVTENNHFGTHEFLDLCEQLDTEPVICANVGTGTPQELAQWVEYVNFDGKSPMADLRRANGREEPWNVKYWGIGNEMWGCGGDMTPDQYAEEYRQFASFVEEYGDMEVVKIGSGPNSTDYEWTEVLMEETTSGWRPLMDAMDLHYYTRTRSGFRRVSDNIFIIDRSGPELSRSATDFGEREWFVTLSQALRIEEIIQRHSTIMDQYDPEKRVGLYVGEWGTWHSVEPGTNPGFLYQQNTLRDALVAGVSLNIFNQHADRVTMANIAQTVNVLQSMILTDEEKMLLTPTYHVFEMYKVHQEATMLPAHLESSRYAPEEESGEEQGGFFGRMGGGQNSIPTLNASASRDDEGTVHITVCNLNPNNSADLECDLRGMEANTVSGRILTAPAMNTHNTFDNPDALQPEEFTDVTLKENMLTTTLPAKSVVLLTVE